MKSILSRPHFLGALAAHLILASLALAQTGPELLIKAWPTGQQVQAQGEVTVANGGSTRNSDDFNIAFYDTSGRVRLLSDNRADPRFGWNFTKIRTSGDSAVPGTMIDTSAAFGMGIADMDGWLAGITLGVGYAGVGAFDDGNAWYGMADLAIGKKIDTHSSIGIVLDYDGNRTFMPDVPIPGFVYTMRLDDQTAIQIGFPFTSIEYKFNEKLTLTAKFSVPDSVEARLDYALAKGIGIFSQLSSRQEAFHWDALPVSSDRVIYDSRRAEVGIRWTPVERLDLTLAGGYLFSQEFNVGWDVRDQDRIAKPSDEAYARFGFALWY